MRTLRGHTGLGKAAHVKSNLIRLRNCVHPNKELKQFWGLMPSYWCPDCSKILSVNGDPIILSTSSGNSRFVAMASYGTGLSGSTITIVPTGSTGTTS